jgi:hypothetical protein
MTMNSFKRNLLTALCILSATSGVQTANASATAQATINWNSFNVQIIDLSGGLNTPVLNWISQKGYAHSSAITDSPLDRQTIETPTVSDFSTVLSANPTTSLAQSSGLRDANVLQATAATRGSVNDPFDPGASAFATVSSYGDFFLTGKGYALLTLDWSMSVTRGNVLDSTDTSLAYVYIFGNFSYYGGGGTSTMLSESLFNDESVLNKNSTFGMAVFSDGVTNVSGSLIASVSASSNFGRPPSSVPVPGAVWLFGSALMGWLGVARRRPTLSLSA